MRTIQAGLLANAVVHATSISMTHGIAALVTSEIAHARWAEAHICVTPSNIETRT
jgi:hypothetical protein